MAKKKATKKTSLRKQPSKSSTNSKKPARKKTPVTIETEVLVKSGRRCCLCFGLDGADVEKEGQIHHLDENPSNWQLANLVFLCMKHHTLVGSTTSQHKNYTANEIKHHRKELYDHVASQRKAAKAKREWVTRLERDDAEHTQKLAHERAEWEAEKKRQQEEMGLQQAKAIHEEGRQFREDLRRGRQRLF